MSPHTASYFSPAQSWVEDEDGWSEDFPGSERPRKRRRRSWKPTLGWKLVSRLPSPERDSSDSSDGEHQSSHPLSAGAGLLSSGTGDAASLASEGEGEGETPTTEPTTSERVQEPYVVPEVEESDCAHEAEACDPVENAGEPKLIPGEEIDPPNDRTNPEVVCDVEESDQMHENGDSDLVHGLELMRSDEQSSPASGIEDSNLAPGLREPRPALCAEEPIPAHGIEMPNRTNGAQELSPGYVVEEFSLAHDVQESSSIHGIEESSSIHGVEEQCPAFGAEKSTSAHGIEESISVHGVEDFDTPLGIEGSEPAYGVEEPNPAHDIVEFEAPNTVHDVEVAGIPLGIEKSRPAHSVEESSRASAVEESNPALEIDDSGPPPGVEKSSAVHSVEESKSESSLAPSIEDFSPIYGIVDSGPAHGVHGSSPVHGVEESTSVRGVEESNPAHGMEDSHAHSVEESNAHNDVDDANHTHDIKEASPAYGVAGSDATHSIEDSIPRAHDCEDVHSKTESNAIQTSQEETLTERENDSFDHALLGVKDCEVSMVPSSVPLRLPSLDHEHPSIRASTDIIQEEHLPSDVLGDAALIDEIRAPPSDEPTTNGRAATRSISIDYLHAQPDSFELPGICQMSSSQLSANEISAQLYDDYNDARQDYYESSLRDYSPTAADWTDHHDHGGHPNEQQHGELPQNLGLLPPPSWSFRGCASDADEVNGALTVSAGEANNNASKSFGAFFPKDVPMEPSIADSEASRVYSDFEERYGSDEEASRGCSDFEERYESDDNSDHGLTASMLPPSTVGRDHVVQSSPALHQSPSAQLHELQPSTQSSNVQRSLRSELVVIDLEDDSEDDQDDCKDDQEDSKDNQHESKYDQDDSINHQDDSKEDQDESKPLSDAADPVKVKPDAAPEPRLGSDAVIPDSMPGVASPSEAIMPMFDRSSPIPTLLSSSSFYELQVPHRDSSSFSCSSDTVFPGASALTEQEAAKSGLDSRGALEFLSTSFSSMDKQEYSSHVPEDITSQLLGSNTQDSEWCPLDDTEGCFSPTQTVPSKSSADLDARPDFAPKIGTQQVAGGIDGSRQTSQVLTFFDGSNEHEHVVYGSRPPRLTSPPMVLDLSSPEMDFPPSLSTQRSSYNAQSKDLAACLNATPMPSLEANAVDEEDLVDFARLADPSPPLKPLDTAKSEAAQLHTDEKPRPSQNSNRRMSAAPLPDSDSIEIGPSAQLRIVDSMATIAETIKSQDTREQSASLLCSDGKSTNPAPTQRRPSNKAERTSQRPSKKVERISQRPQWSSQSQKSACSTKSAISSSLSQASLVRSQATASALQHRQTGGTGKASALKSGVAVTELRPTQSQPSNPIPAAKVSARAKPLVPSSGSQHKTALKIKEPVAKAPKAKGKQSQRTAAPGKPRQDKLQGSQKRDCASTDKLTQTKHSQSHNSGAEPPTASQQPTLPKLTPLKSSSQLYASGFRTPTAYYHPLSSLCAFLNASTAAVDVLAVVSKVVKLPCKAAVGPRDYYTSFRITDSSIHSSGRDEVEVRVFRPYRTALPIVSRGDVVLLQSFRPRGISGQDPFAASIDATNDSASLMLLSDAESAWCIWHASDLDFPVCNGPPVEYGVEEENIVKQVRHWWLATSDESPEGAH